ncbi:hypothetical protein [Clostridium chrysemydis]|nr:hypothetical protein [Clostridium chrysemydis]
MRLKKFIAKNISLLCVAASVVVLASPCWFWSGETTPPDSLLDNDTDI